MGKQKEGKEKSGIIVGLNKGHVSFFHFSLIQQQPFDTPVTQQCPCPAQPGASSNIKSQPTHNPTSLESPVQDLTNAKPWMK